ncbi:MAG: glycosyltransferase family 4 protein [Bacteroidetes bacterium]|nr:glycosyltransferase family 4 protein [Bacteroidota bacterium]
MNRRLVVDLLKVKNLNTGLGQVSLQFAQAINNQINYIKQSGLDPLFLWPDSIPFDQKSSLIETIDPSFVGRIVPSISSDIWHSIHQQPSFLPQSNSKYILTIHDLNFIYEKGALKQKLGLQKLKKLISRADRVVTISDFAKSEVLKYIPEMKSELEVIYNGVEDLTCIEVIKPQMIEGDKPFFFVIGHFSAKKNMHVLLDMMVLLPDYQLVIAGQNKTEYGDFVRLRMQELKLQNVNLLGTISQSEKVWLYGNCEAFLFPSLYEGFGLPVIEAMQFGKPVITSNATSLPEIGGGYTALWQNFESEYMKQVVTEHIKSSSTRSEEAKDYAKSFSWERNLKRYVKLYTDLLK